MRNQVVHFCDFIDYFRDLSAAIENDEYFQAVALNAWVLPAQDDREGSGDAVNTDSCRALVTHPDGVQEARTRLIVQQAYFLSVCLGL